MSKGTNGEKVVRQLFAERYGLQLEKIDESDRPSPDFEVLALGTRIAVLEVKTTEYTGLVMDLDEVEDRFAEMERATGAADLLAGSLQNDNAVNRLAKKIHQGAKQLERYAEPKVLAFVNEDDSADCSDLREALVGFLVDDDGNRHTTAALPVHERLRQDRTRIDLYFWIDLFGDPEIRAVRWTTEVGHRLWDEHFKPRTVEPAP
jgi:hypothetical protein